MAAETSQTLDRGLRVLEVLAATPNGLTVTGLAATVSDRIAQAGYKTGQPNTYTDQQRSASVVFYASNRAREQAQAVAKVLDISDVERIVDAARVLAGGSDVVVVVGSDQSTS